MNKEKARIRACFHNDQTIEYFVYRDNPEIKEIIKLTKNMRFSELKDEAEKRNLLAYFEKTKIFVNTAIKTSSDYYRDNIAFEIFISSVQKLYEYEIIEIIIEDE